MDATKPLSELTLADTSQPLQSCAFGHEMREKHFSFAPTHLPLNHGSFGTHPKYVRDRLRFCQDLSEARPDTFVRYQFPEMLDANRKAMAEFLSLPVDEVVFVPNTTTAINVVLRNLHFEQGDVVLRINTVYGAVEKAIRHLEETTPLRGIMLKVQYPVEDDVLLKRFQNTIKEAKAEGKNVRIANFDTVSSTPGVRVPWERLVEICKAEGVLSMVDGAHSVGCIELNLASVQPDFFASNLHKWLFVPRGCAVFHVPKRNHHLIRTSFPTSHGYKPLPNKAQNPIFNPLLIAETQKSRFEQIFEFVATIDVSPYLCVEEALKFRHEVCGGERQIMDYCTKISNQAGENAARMFGTRVMENAGQTLSRSPMTNVGLPLNVGDGQNEIPQDHMYDVAVWMTEKLAKEYDIYLPVVFHAGEFLIRLSGQIYLEVDDFNVAFNALGDLCKRASKGEYRH